MNWLTRLLGIGTTAREEQPSQRTKRDPVLHRALPPEMYTHRRDERKKRDPASKPHADSDITNSANPLFPAWLGASSDDNSKSAANDHAPTKTSNPEIGVSGVSDNTTTTTGGGGSPVSDSGTGGGDGGGGGGGGDISCDPALDFPRRMAFKL